MKSRLKDDWYLYREYGRKMKHHGKLSGAFAVISIFVLLLVSVIYGTLDSYIETLRNGWQLRKLTVMEAPGEEVCSLLREKYADNPDIEDIWIDYSIPVDFVEGPSELEKYILHSANDIIKNDCKQTRDQEELLDDQMIIPKFLILDKINDIGNTAVSGEQFVGQNVTVSYAGMTKTFKIVGTYDSSKIMQNYCYISEDNVTEMAKAMEIDNYLRCYVLLKDQDQVEKYKDEIESLIDERYAGEFGAPEPSVQRTASMKRQETAVSFFNFVLSMAFVLAVVTLLWSGLGILLSQLKQLNLRKSELGLLKAIGYQNRQLSGMLRMEALMFSARILLIAGLLTVVIVLVYTGWVLFFVSGLYQSIFLPKFNLILLLPILLAVGIPLAAYEFSARKMKKIMPIEALR